MADAPKNSPLLGYNTNVRHNGTIFHIQTEDSGVEHPHIITHLFVEGTILATKKISYMELLESDDLEAGVRQLMKDQHKAMFVELRDGHFDENAEKILDKSGSKDAKVDKTKKPDTESPDRPSEAPTLEIDGGTVKVIRPASMDQIDEELAENEPKEATSVVRGRSIFDMPDNDGQFGDALITDKSLDEVILSYLTDELEE